jgi:hypothetical protein
MDLFFVVAFIGAGIWVVVFACFVLPVLYSYDVAEGSIRILLFSKFPIARFRISEIANVEIKRTASLLLRPFFALRFGNRLSGECVVITKRRGILRTIIITPRQPADFVSRIRQQAHAA